MSVDSAVTLDFSDSREYTTGRKSYMFPGIGCVSTWGARDGNRIGPYLDECLNSKKDGVEQLARAVGRFLNQEYRPHLNGLGEVGYHIAGFDSAAQPRLFHVYYAFERPRRRDQMEPEYQHHDHSPGKDATFMLYNGRNDLADVVVRCLVDQVRNRADLQFNLNDANDLVRFSDFVSRFAGEITREVGPPFLTRLIRPDNRAEQFRNDRFSPLFEGCVGVPGKSSSAPNT